MTFVGNFKIKKIKRKKKYKDFIQALKVFLLN